MDGERESENKPWYKKWWAIALLIILIIGVIFIVLIFQNNLRGCPDNSINMSDEEILNLFGESPLGVLCMGENYGAAIGSGGIRQIPCRISIGNKTEESYSLEVEKIISASGEPQTEVDSWVVDTNWTGTVTTGQKTVSFLILDIPKKIESTVLNITLKEKNINTGNEQFHNLTIDVKEVGSKMGFKEKIESIFFSPGCPL